jgi:large subunit ribosomal protein L22
MTGPKTNEGATKVGERVGTRAQVRYIRSSATKAREVLDLIRGKSAREADAILQFTERDIAIVIRKALASAVANAQHNDGQDPEELYVAACFADEGPTLKRFRPRARGRATRVRKRTCHITVIVARMSEGQLEHLRRKEERQPAAAAQGHDHEHDHDEDVEVGEPTEAMVEEAADENDGVEIAAASDDIDDDVEAGEPTPEMVAEATSAEAADDDENTKGDA